MGALNNNLLHVFNCLDADRIRCSTGPVQPHSEQILLQMYVKNIAFYYGYSQISNFLVDPQQIDKGLYSLFLSSQHQLVH